VKPSTQVKLKLTGPLRRVIGREDLRVRLQGDEPTIEDLVVHLIAEYGDAVGSFLLDKTTGRVSRSVVFVVDGVASIAHRQPPGEIKLRAGATVSIALPLEGG